MEYNITEKEKQVLNYIKENKPNKRFFKLDTSKVAEHFEIDETYVLEMIDRFQDKGLIKKDQNRYKVFKEVVLEVLVEGIFSNF